MNRFETLALLGLAVAASTCHPSPASAATYYLSAQGADTNKGTSAATPFASLARVNAVLRAGDTVRIRRGDVFFGTFRPAVSGTMSSPITIGAYEAGHHRVQDNHRLEAGHEPERPV
jgi:hypothetical protein